jgi:hypothetical protein
MGAGRKILNVKQGYSKCSIAVIGTDAAITSDTGIYNTLIANGIDVLKIDSGSIRLDGVSYGFIGGVSGLIAPDVLAVNGNIEAHPESEKIKEFCNKHGVSILSLNNEELYDIGSILPIF